MRLRCRRMASMTFKHRDFSVNQIEFVFSKITVTQTNKVTERRLNSGEIMTQSVLFINFRTTFI